MGSSEQIQNSFGALRVRTSGFTIKINAKTNNDMSHFS